MPKPFNPTSAANRERDAEIVRLAAQGQTPKEIAEAIGLNRSRVAQVIRVARMTARYQPAPSVPREP